MATSFFHAAVQDVQDDEAGAQELAVLPTARGSPCGLPVVRRSFYGHEPSMGNPDASALDADDAPSSAAAASPTPAAGLGIVPPHSAVPARVPVGSKTTRASPPETPPSAAYQPNQSFAIGTPTSSAAASPRTGLLGGQPRPLTVFERVRDAVAPRKYPSPDSDPDDAVGGGSPGHGRSTATLDGEASAARSSKDNGTGDNGGAAAAAADDDDDDDELKNNAAKPPTHCWSKHDILQRRNHWLSIVTIALSVYSTVGSGLWLGVALAQPRWGHSISSRGSLEPSTSTMLTTLLAKTIELSFVTVFISCLGQRLTRRALAQQSEGMTLADMSMRNWVIQPGSLMTHFETLPYAGLTVLGALSLTSTIAAMLYTTASDAMVAPKLKMSDWTDQRLTGFVRSAYANPKYVHKSCLALLIEDDQQFAEESCNNVRFSGQSHRDLLSFLETWADLARNGSASGLGKDLARRPVGTALLYDNTTMRGSWIETEHADVARLSGTHGRIVNNVTMAMPHPGVYAAARNSVNRILQPEDLNGVGEYAIRAGVVSPSIGVLCVAMSPKELEPLVYTTWPHITTELINNNESLKTGKVDWYKDVPTWPDPNFLNRTVVDDLFRWGPKYRRLPPVFPLYPPNYQLIFNSTASNTSDAVYVLGRASAADNYTLCEMRSWVSPNCSTHFNISGTTGTSMRAHCEDASDSHAYLRSMEREATWDSKWPAPERNWKWIAQEWGLSLDLNGGTRYNNASNARILTQLALTKSELPVLLPSLAEALAVFGSSTLVVSSIDTSLRHDLNVTTAPYNITIEPGVPQSFHASVITQEFTSGHIEPWKGIFYVVLALVFVINICCLIYLSYYAYNSGNVTDFTEPQNFFALAINSPPSAQLEGSCGGGPRDRDLVVPWRVGYAMESNHYFFQEANEKPWRGKYSKASLTTAADLDVTGSSYKRLSTGPAWP